MCTEVASSGLTLSCSGAATAASRCGSAAGAGVAVTATVTAAARASTPSTASATMPLDSTGRWSSAPSRTGRRGSETAGDATGGCGAGSGSATTRNGSRTREPRRNGRRDRTRTAATAEAPTGSCTWSGWTRKPSASSGSDATTFSEAAALPQLLIFTVCRPDQRPVEVTGVSEAVRPSTRPTERSPSAAADVPGSTTDWASTQNGTSPAPPADDGGPVNTTVAALSWPVSTRTTPLSPDALSPVVTTSAQA